jgi:hypothetical protein
MMAATINHFRRNGQFRGSSGSLWLKLTTFVLSSTCKSGESSLKISSEGLIFAARGYYLMQPRATALRVEVLFCRGVGDTGSITSLYHALACVVFCGSSYLSFRSPSQPSDQSMQHSRLPHAANKSRFDAFLH